MARRDRRSQPAWPPRWSPAWGAGRCSSAGWRCSPAGWSGSPRCPSTRSYLADLLGPSLLIAVGLGLAFVPITILAETGVHDREYGLASGLVNTSQQIGGALGLAVLTTIATTRTNHLIATQHPINQALTQGFHIAFLGAAGFVLLGIIAAASIGTRHGKRSRLPQQARHPEPQT